MTDLAVTDALFFERTGMEPGRVGALVAQSLAGMDDGELYLEYSQSESLALDDGVVRGAGGRRVALLVEAPHHIDQQTEDKGRDQSNDDQKFVVKGPQPIHNRGRGRLKPELPRLGLCGLGDRRGSDYAWHQR